MVRYNLPFVNTYAEPVFKALADPTRRSIFELLGVGPRPVVEIARAVPISRPAVSQHLKVLKDCGLVSVSAVGTRRIYRLNPDGLRDARDYFDQFWPIALAAYADAVNKTMEER
jgi:DNA-binding transcriptional ArsR family regulator